MLWFNDACFNVFNEWAKLEISVNSAKCKCVRRLLQISYRRGLEQHFVGESNPLR